MLAFLQSPCVRLQFLIGLYSYARNINGAVLNDYLIYASCKSDFGSNYSRCETLHINSTSEEVLEIERIVQPQVSEINTVNTGIESALPAITVLFLGSWSDTYGRKPILLHVIICSLLHITGIAIVSLTDANPWYTIIASIPISLSGGYMVVLILGYTYMCDVTDPDSRTWQLSCMSMMSCIGGLLGDITGPVIYNKGGYFAVFISSAGLFCVACLFMVCCVPESLPHKNIGASTTILRKCVQFCKLFNVRLVKDSIAAVVEKREGIDLGVCWICLICIGLVTFGEAGEMTIKYLFANARLGWGIVQFAHYSIALDLIIWTFGIYLGAKILRPLLGLSDALTCAIFTISGIGDLVTKSLVWQSWHMYLSLILGVFKACTKPALRSILSAVVPTEDIGKVFALSTSLEIIVGFGATSLCGLIYSYTLPPMYPSPVWLVLAGFYFLSTLLLIYLHVKQVRC